MNRETVLVTAAAGGVGMAAVDIASNVLNAKVEAKRYNLRNSNEWC